MIQTKRFNKLKNSTGRLRTNLARTGTERTERTGTRTRTLSIFYLVLVPVLVYVPAPVPCSFCACSVPVLV